jgi:cell division protein FtsN
MKFQTRRLLIVLGLGSGSGLFHCAIAKAQMPPVLHRLSPPPAVRAVPSPSPSSNPVPDTKSTPQTPNDRPAGREYIFRASQRTPITDRNNNDSVNSSELYRVQVLGRSAAILARVRQIEPTAFIRRGETVIQVGLFRSRSQAEQQLQQLKSQGLSAQIVTANDYAGSNRSTPISRRFSQ